MRELPPLNALRAFEAAARRGSFKGAAEELQTQGGLKPRQFELFACIETHHDARSHAVRHAGGAWQRR